MAAKWTNIEPGALALEGSDFQIRHKPQVYGLDWCVYQGEREIGVFGNLDSAKSHAVKLLADLREIGAAP